MATDDKLYRPGLTGQPLAPKARGPLRREFLVPPFSVLDARDGAWQARKSAWLGLGIQSEVGRDGNLLSYSAGASLGAKDTSIFDPVLAEVCYRWFCPAGGVVLDPFAGGSVRGVVASALGLRYWGSELRQAQVDANYAQRGLCDGNQYQPKWVCGDSRGTVATAPAADFIFTCPPYGDLERYSDDPADLSTMSAGDFADSYAYIITHASKRLRPNRFACYVVGNYRDADGLLVDLAGLTTAANASAGLRLYNDAVLLTAVGSASMRGRRIFNGGRKLCKVHQYVLIYIKGDPKQAAEACACVAT